MEHFPKVEHFPNVEHFPKVEHSFSDFFIKRIFPYQIDGFFIWESQIGPKIVQKGRLFSNKKVLHFGVMHYIYNLGYPFFN